jgi:RIO kinase 2
VKEIFEYYMDITGVEWRIINSIFRNMWSYKFVPVEVIMKHSGVREEKLQRVLKSLGSDGVVENRNAPYVGSSLTFIGLSLYSLRTLVSRGKVDMIGKKMGEGKESVIYNCYSERYGECVLKFHRLGAMFKKIKEKRDYGDLHLNVLSVRSAGREYKALKKLFGVVNVPEPFAWEGNAVLMELINGRELFKTKLEDPQEVLEIILDGVRKMVGAGIVHGDLSQFNILVSEDIYFIDFPQYIEIDVERDEWKEYGKVEHGIEENGGEKDEEGTTRAKMESWRSHLERDVRNILQFFKKSYGIEKDINSVMNYIIGR